MANWQRKLKLKDVWPKAKAQTITPQELAFTIAERLGKLLAIGHKIVDQRKADLISDLEDFAQDVDAGWDDIDDLLVELYDWADIELDDKWPTVKVCWVETF